MGGAAAQADRSRPHMSDPVDDTGHSQNRWIGRRLGAYRILSLIASGGMGEVYRAERADGQYEQQVAVKVMRQRGDEPRSVQRFIAERRILAALVHPNLAKVLDGGVTGEGLPYFVMELVAGEPIDVHAERTRLAIDQRVQIFRTVCRVVHSHISKAWCTAT
jgi:eukaryotic-like serine/threonine-protein kinase